MIRRKIERILTMALYLAGAVAVTTLLLEHGFRVAPIPSSLLHWMDFVIVGIFISNTFIRLFIAPDKPRHLKTHIADLILAVMLIATLFVVRELVPYIHHKNVLSVTKLYLIAMQIYILVYMVFHLSFVGKRLNRLGLRPPQVVLLSFLIVVVVGTLLLSLPNATASGQRAPFLTALFTATSATTVTGLIVVDTGSYFSMFGQITILALIQIGGLGMMTLFSFFAVIVGRSMSLRENAIVSDILDLAFMGKVRQLIITIILTTMAFELIGTGLLYATLSKSSFVQDKVFYFSLFHAISAFSNAGFSLFTDNFMKFRDNYSFNFIIIALVVFGGLGFQVLRNILAVLRNRLSKSAEKERFSLHSKLVLVTSGILLALGFFIFFTVPGEVGAARLPSGERAMMALFQSMTTRTAGFNTIDIGAVSIPFIFTALVLMFIGASPGSTGGGIKTSTAAVIFAFMLSIFSGKDKVNAFKRRIPDELVKKTLAVLVGSFSLIAVITFLLTLFEKFAFMDLLFEAVSAVGTVGLSRGITPYLSSEGKILISIAMFLGRIGPLTIFLALTYTKKNAVYEYPEERVLIG